MEPPLPARQPDDPFDGPYAGRERPLHDVGYDVGEFPQGSPFSRWALARYIVGRVILERVSWSLLVIALVLVVLGVVAYVALDSTFLTVVIGIVVVMILLLRAVLRAVLRKLMGAGAYGPLEDRLNDIIGGASSDVLGELRRVGLPSRLITLPLIGVRLVGKRRKDTLEKIRNFEVERAVSRARLDELHMLVREATGSSGLRPPSGPTPPMGPPA